MLQQPTQLVISCDDIDLTFNCPVTLATDNFDGAITRRTTRKTSASHIRLILIWCCARHWKTQNRRLRI